ncbi:RNA polymerase sigma-70 factor [Mucilaginibacter corticis]|uniref:RNA polymerase sigma-70 factor n=1 Tax=Mucilaginibacter corticis TaxID=2597670 RepID=A0A556MX27_9SPHI|nr:RNA polymerase sigma-70 factor [Mucilaginibacter corticis]TSJ44476.1 RNA polymerase sigma-70 factor [Mucilaginibacter corticis]
MTNYRNVSDQALVAFLKEGAQGAYTEIYDRYIFNLLNHAYNITRNREEAKDIVQEVFTKLWAKRHEVEITTNLAGFLYTAVKNIILNEVNHKSVQSKYYSSILRFSVTPEIVTDHRVRENQLTAIIEKEIAALPPKMRQVFTLSRKKHLSHREIAERLGISEATVSRHISNALKELRVKLGLFTFIMLILSQK